jgi:predicted Fe-Mo cluster-binding NifX family protein
MLRIVIVLIMLVLMFPPCSAGEEDVIIAVASDGKTLKDSVSQLAARCPYFLFIDGTGKLLEAVDNPYVETIGGAGVSAANFLAERNVTIVIAGMFGDKMRNVLETKEIAYFESQGTVEEAIKKVLEKKDRI